MLEDFVIALGVESSFDMSNVNVGALGLAVPLILPSSCPKLHAPPTRTINIWLSFTEEGSRSMLRARGQGMGLLHGGI